MEYYLISIGELLCCVSLSTTIVLAYLMYKNKLSVLDALAFVRTKRPIVNPNYGFVSIFKINYII